MNLDRGISFVEQHTGTSAKFSGVHPGRGTRNARLRSAAESVWRFSPPIHSTRLNLPIDDLAKHLRDSGIRFSGPSDGARQRPDGKLLRWRTLGLNDDRHGLLPFFIEWNAESIHPSVDAPPDCHLTDFKVVASDPEELTKMFGLLDLDIAVERNGRRN